MTSDQRDVDIAAFADRFAVVDGFQDGEEPCVLLDVTCQGVEVFGAFMARQFRPLWLGLVRGGNGLVHVGVGALGHVGNDIARCGVGHGKGFACGRKRAVDEMAKASLMIVEPFANDGCVLWCGAVVEVGKKRCNIGHLNSLTRWRGGLRRNSGL